MSAEQQTYMQRALQLARQALGRTAPNPPVGAVIVKDGQIVGEGYHPRAGDPHAEIFALRQAGEQARGGDIYVTLEPCSHYGKTPPCADALIAAGLKSVFIGVRDPNPQVSGRGIERLRDAGVRVEIGLLEEQCRELIGAFRKHILTGLPYCTYKTAMTLDGNTATTSGDSRWVSGASSRQYVHQLRNCADAIMVGIETVLQDDPLLNTRLPGEESHDPVRIVVDSQLRMSPGSRMLNQQSAAGTLIATCCTDKDKIVALEQAGAELIVLPSNTARVDLVALWKELGQRNLQSLLLEGGATLAAAALEHQLIDRMMVFIAAKVLGGNAQHGIFHGPGCAQMAQAIELDNSRVELLDGDFLMTGEVRQCLPG